MWDGLYNDIFFFFNFNYQRGSWFYFIKAPKLHAELTAARCSRKPANCRLDKNVSVRLQKKSFYRDDSPHNFRIKQRVLERTNSWLVHNVLSPTLLIRHRTASYGLFLVSFHRKKRSKSFKSAISKRAIPEIMKKLKQSLYDEMWAPICIIWAGDFFSTLSLLYRF